MAFIAFFNSQERVYILYLLTAIVFAYLVYFYEYRKEIFGKDRSLRVKENFLQFCFSSKNYFHRSSLIDCLIFLMTPLINLLFVFPILISANFIAYLSNGFLENVFGSGDFWLANNLIIIFFSFSFLLFYDFAQFIAHYLMHKVWFLWEFHKIHHSAETLTPFTAYRFHPFDNLFTLTLISLMTGLCQGIFNWLFVGNIQFYEIAGLHIGVFLFYFFAYNLRHSHIWLDYGPLFDRIFISPAQHQIHHSVEPRHIDKNFGFIFAFWDWFFHSLYVPKQKEIFSVGLTNDEHLQYRKFLNIFIMPFFNISNKLWSKAKSRTNDSAPQKHLD